MTFYYVEDYCDFDYYVSWDEIRYALIQIVGGEDIEECCKLEEFADEYEMAEWYRDDLKDYFEEEALEWYRENK